MRIDWLGGRIILAPGTSTGQQMRYNQAIENIKNKSKTGKALIEKLEAENGPTHVIQFTNDPAGDASGTTRRPTPNAQGQYGSIVIINLDDIGKDAGGGYKPDLEELLVHELTHSSQAQDGGLIPNPTPEQKEQYENEACKTENLYNQESGNGKTRKYYDGRLLPPDVISPKPVTE